MEIGANCFNCLQGLRCRMDDALNREIVFKLNKPGEVLRYALIVIDNQDFDVFHETIPRLEPSLLSNFFTKTCLGSDKDN